MDEVNFRIKSPSAALPDLQLTIRTDQTVLYIKERIEEKYETRPSPSDQKLVYSGKLIQDNLVIKDFLRFEDECSVYTIHLVCKMEPTPVQPTLVTNTDSGLRNRSQGGLVNNEILPPLPAPSTADSPEAVELEAVRGMLQSFNPHQGNLSPAEYQTVQEAYSQYMNLYTQYIQSVHHQSPLPPANPEPAAPAQAAPGVVEPGNNDLLDYAYAVIRVLILLCVMYVHSSFFRLLFVAGGLLLAYLFQNRNGRGEINNNQENNIPEEVVNPEEAEPDSEPTADVEDSLDDESNTEPKPNMLMVAFTFVSTLVSSIIPEHNQVI